MEPRIQIQISTKRCGNKMASIATMLPWRQTDGKMGNFGKDGCALRPKKKEAFRTRLILFVLCF